MIYFDTSYLVRLYLDDPGFDLVRSLAGTGKIASSFHGEIETIAALHRVYRDRRITQADYTGFLDEFQRDRLARAYSRLHAGREPTSKLEAIYRNASPKLFLRASDALHLICTRENGFTDIYSNVRTCSRLRQYSA